MHQSVLSVSSVAEKRVYPWRGLRSGTMRPAVAFPWRFPMSSSSAADSAACMPPAPCAARRSALTLVDRRNHHVFQPLLYQVAMAALSPGDIASPIRWILRQQRTSRCCSRRSVASIASAASADARRRRAVLRLPDRGERRDARVLRPRRVAADRAGAQDARRRPRHPPPRAAGVRARRTRDRSANRARAAADVRRHRRRPDRRRDGRRARRDLAAVAGARLPALRSQLGARHAARGGARRC